MVDEWSISPNRPGIESSRAVIMERPADEAGR
jgi:hypothetical protein